MDVIFEGAHQNQSQQATTDLLQSTAEANCGQTANHKQATSVTMKCKTVRNGKVTRISPVEAEAVASSSACWGSLLNIHDSWKVEGMTVGVSLRTREQSDNARVFV